MRYAHIISFFNQTPWAILPEKFYAILELIEIRARGMTSLHEFQALTPSERFSASQPSSIAVLPIFGTIANRAGLLQRASGGMSVEQFTRDFRAAVRNPDVSAIVLDIDSPGGATSGVEEIADEIHSARSKKRIIASVNSLAASAAYWIASSAHEIAVTPSGHVGSIGVLGVHMDVSEKAKAEGVTVSVVSAGKYKAEASEFGSLSPEARQHLQALVDDRYEAFVRAVARGRGVPIKTVRGGFGEGRVVTAKDALRMGMVDSIETTDQVISRTVGRAQRSRKLAEAASWQLELQGEESLPRLVSVTAGDLIAEDDLEFVTQAIVANKSQWPVADEARAWARSNGFRADVLRDMDASWHLEQRDAGDFRRLRSKPIDGSKMMAIGGPLKDGVARTVKVDAAVDLVLDAGVIPADISTELAAEGTAWTAPTLQDFVRAGVASSANWSENTEAEKRKVAMHAAWTPKMPPEKFADIKLFHHRPADGKVVPDGARNAKARANQVEGIGPDLPRVVAHLDKHLEAVQERRQEALANPALDPRKRLVQIMELG